MDTIELVLPRIPTSVARARAGLRPLRDVLGERYQDAILLVSEVVTNSIRHGEGATVRLIGRVNPESCRIEVIDGGAGFSPESAGRGLAMVAALADAWGAYEGSSTHVWFEFDLRTPAA